jgi:dipeptidyl aminopeptidase/acylaminoacyl peptidase
MRFWSSSGVLAVWTIDAILRISEPSSPQIHPDGKHYAVVWKGDVYAGKIDGSGPNRVGAGTMPRWIPGSNRLAYLAPSGQVESAAGRSLTRSPSPIRGFAFDSTGRAIYFLALEPGKSPDPIVSSVTPRRSWLFRQRESEKTADVVAPREWHIISFAISPDGGRAACAVQRSPWNRDVFHVDLHELDLRTGEVRPLAAQPGRDADPSYSPDGRWIAFHSQGGTWNYFEARHVAVVPSTGGSIRYLTKDAPWDVFRNGNTFHWSDDSRFVTYTAGDRTQDILVRQSVESAEGFRLAERVSGTVSITPDSKATLVLKTTPSRPARLAVLDSSGDRILWDPNADVTNYPKIESQVITWTSPDGTPVEGILWLPIGYQSGARVPLLVELHGGPTGVALNRFPAPRTYPTQAFLQAGIAVFAPNFRGSANYGAAFRLKNSLSQGIGDYADVMSGVDTLIERGIADSDRLGIMGWSYGGYLTASVISRTQRFRAASIGAPAVDWTTYYGQFDGSKEVLWTYFGGTPWEKPENYARHSVRSRLGNIRTPSLLQVGALDIDHNREIFQALSDRGVEVEYVVYPREGHGIIEVSHQRDLLDRNLRLFLRHLSR